MTPKWPTRLALILGAAALLLAPPLVAQAYDETFDFTVDEWIELDLEEVPITIHRLRLQGSDPGIAARIARNQRYVQQLELQLEFTNDGSQDWEAEVQVEWLDQAGDVIEGIETDFDLDGRDRRKIRREKKSVNRYGLSRAVRLSIRIELDPD